MANNKRADFQKRLRQKEAKIRKSGNIVDVEEQDIHDIMHKYSYDKYRIEVWGDISLTSDFDNWIIEIDDVVVKLKHMTKGSLSRKGNMRSSYHIQNVFYDLDYCVKSIREHDEHTREKGRVQ